MAARFEIRQPRGGQYTWVVTSQGRTLATGESYGRRGGAEKAIEALREAVATATVVDLTLPATRPARAATKSTKAAKKTAAKATKTAKASAKTPTAKKAAAPRKRSSRTG